MNLFKSLLLIILVILVGGLGALYWAQNIETVDPVDSEIIEPDSETQTSQEDETELSGTYLVFQSSETTDEGEKDWANDNTDTFTFYRLALGDIGSEEPEVFSVIEHGPEFSGSLTTYVFGQDLLLHRYETDRVYDASTGRPDEGEERDAIMDFSGDIIDVQDEQWGRIRSENNEFEVVWGSRYDDSEEEIVVTDIENEEVLLTIPMEEFMEESEQSFEPEPFAINNAGTYVYIRQTCGCAAFPSGIWEVEVESGEVRRLDTLIDLEAWTLSDIDPEHRVMIAIHTQSQPSEDGPGQDYEAPTTIQIIDLETEEVTDVLYDEEDAWSRPFIDPVSADRYIVRLWGEGNELYLAQIEDEDLTQENYFVDGWLTDWVDEWVVLQDPATGEINIVNVNTKEEVEIVLPGERYKYLGAITLNE